MVSSFVFVLFKCLNVTAFFKPVGEIQCSFSTQGSSVEDLIVARLKRPTGFKGPPLFADDRSVFPETDRVCQIKQDKNDPAELAFDLRITDFARCGVLKRNVSVL